MRRAVGWGGGWSGDGGVGGEVKRSTAVIRKTLCKWDPVPGQSLPSFGEVAVFVLCLAVFGL